MAQQYLKVLPDLRALYNDLNGGALGSYQEIQTSEMPNVAILVKPVADSKLNVELTKNINSNANRFSKRA